MIVSLILDLLKALFLFIIGLLPTIPTLDYDSSFGALRDVLLSVNMFVDLKLLGSCLVALLFCYNARFIWSIVMWVVRKIPGVS